MAIKIDIHTIKNAQGQGEDRDFVKVLPQPTRTPEELEQEIQHNCTLTAADIRAMLTSLRDIVARDLAERGAFHIPEIGYLSLQVVNNYPKDADMAKLKGNHVGVRNVLFMPEASLLTKVRHDACFQRLKGTTQSRQWAEEDLRDAVMSYLDSHQYITVSTLRQEFQLSDYMARQCLRRLVDDGLLARQGARNSYFYMQNC